MTTIKPSATVAKTVAAAVLSTTAAAAPNSGITIEQRVKGIETTLATYFKTAETDVETDGEKAWTWIKANVVHLVGYTSIVTALLKLKGLF